MSINVSELPRTDASILAYAHAFSLTLVADLLCSVTPLWWSVYLGLGICWTVARGDAAIDCVVGRAVDNGRRRGGADCSEGAGE